MVGDKFYLEYVVCTLGRVVTVPSAVSLVVALSQGGGHQDFCSADNFELAASGSRHVLLCHNLDGSSVLVALLLLR